MRALILSDIHANLEALEAVLAAAPAHDALWNLGDLVSYCASPNEVMDTLRPLKGIAIRGNHDKAAAGSAPPDCFNPAAARAIEWTRSTLSAANRAALARLLVGPVYPIENVACAHGSPLDEDRYIQSRREAWIPLNEARELVTFIGHTHVQNGYMLAHQLCTTLQPQFTGAAERERFVLQLEEGKRYLINPGSVGQPRDNDWRAAFALYNSEALRIEWYRVPYDVERTQRKIRKAGLPERLASRLSKGM